MVDSPCIQRCIIPGRLYSAFALSTQTYNYTLKPILDASSSHGNGNSGSGLGFGGSLAASGFGSAASSVATSPMHPNDSPSLLGGGSQQSSRRGGRGSSVMGFEVQIVMELCDRGSLRAFLDQRESGGGGGGFRRLTASGECVIDYKAVLRTAADIAKGMAQLHSMDIVHSDCKVSAGLY